MEEYDGIICLPRGAETSDCLDVARATLAGLMAAVMTMACALVQPFEVEAELLWSVTDSVNEACPLITRLN